MSTQKKVIFLISLILLVACLSPVYGQTEQTLQASDSYTDIDGIDTGTKDGNGDTIWEAAYGDLEYTFVGDQDITTTTQDIGLRTLIHFNIDDYNNATGFGSMFVTLRVAYESLEGSEINPVDLSMTTRKSNPSTTMKSFSSLT